MVGHGLKPELVLVKALLLVLASGLACVYDTSINWTDGRLDANPADGRPDGGADLPHSDHGRDAPTPDQHAEVGLQDLAPMDLAAMDLAPPDLAAEAAPFCGDGKRSGSEQCDGKDLGGKTCKSLGHSGGPLGCKGTCVVDTSACYRVLDNSGLAISKAQNNQLDPAVASDGNNFLVAYTDNRKTSKTDLYGTRVTASGMVLDPSGFVISKSSGYQMHPAVAFGKGTYLVVWDDTRSSSNGRDIYSARVSPSGAVQDKSGIPIVKLKEEQSFPAVAFDGLNFMVAWHDGRNGTLTIYVARISPAGTLLDPAGVQVSAGKAGHYYPSLAFDGKNYLVVWQHGSAWGSITDIHGARVSPGAKVLDKIPLVISAASKQQTYPAVAFDGTVHLVAWSDKRGGTDYEIYGARVSPAGKVLDGAGIAIAKAKGNQYQPAVAASKAGFLVAWQDYRGGTDYDIFGARVTSAGQVLDPGGMVISAAAQSQQQCSLARAAGGNLVTWQDQRNGSATDIYSARVTP